MRATPGRPPKAYRGRYQDAGRTPWSITLFIDSMWVAHWCLPDWHSHIEHAPKHCSPRLRDLASLWRSSHVCGRGDLGKTRNQFPSRRCEWLTTGAGNNKHRQSGGRGPVGGGSYWMTTGCTCRLLHTGQLIKPKLAAFSAVAWRSCAVSTSTPVDGLKTP